MASSTQNLHHQLRHLSNPHIATAAPPPTPSAQSNLSSSDATSDALFHLLHRLPPTLSLSLPARRSATTTATPPVIRLSDSKPSLNSAVLSAATQLGFFQLSPHAIPSHLPLAAESSAASLFNLPLPQKQALFPNNWPLGFDSIDDEDDAESFCLDSSCSIGSADESGLDMGSLRDFSREMERLGLEVVEELASAGGFQNPTRDEPFRACSLMWISKGGNPGRTYPYVVGLHYQLRSQKYSLLSDPGRVDVSGLEVDSVLVTIGDIAQVWSNGKFKKVRGIPVPSMEESKSTSNCITMSLLITLPLESTVSPLIPNLAALDDVIEQDEDEKSCFDSTDNSTVEQMMFRPFSFEDYAWRVYHERLHLKDPLVRYRV